MDPFECNEELLCDEPTLTIEEQGPQVKIQKILSFDRKKSRLSSQTTNKHAGFPRSIPASLLKHTDTNVLPTAKRSREDPADVDDVFDAHAVDSESDSPRDGASLPNAGAFSDPAASPRSLADAALLLSPPLLLPPPPVRAIVVQAPPLRSLNAHPLVSPRRVLIKQAACVRASKRQRTAALGPGASPAPPLEGFVKLLASRPSHPTASS